MSGERWELDVTPTAEETYEAMVLAGNALLKGRAQVFLTLQSFFGVFFAPLGATLCIGLAAMLGWGVRMEDLPVWAVPVTLVTFALLAIWLSRRAYFMIAQAAVRSRFGRAQRIVLDASGVTLTTNDSRWHSGWRDVQTVRTGKKVLCIGISGIAIAVPRRAFLGPQDADDALSAAQRWLEDAR